MIRSWLSGGYRVIVDKIGYAKIADNAAKCGVQGSVPSQNDYSNSVQNFWFHAIRAQKKLLRGEIWTAKGCIDGYMKTLLRQMWEYQMKASCGANFEP